MISLLYSEKERYKTWKQNTKYLSINAKQDGIYRGKCRSFCIPRNLSKENLYEGIRVEAVDFFGKYQIKWHDGIDRKPSNHLCDSQVCCVNFLFHWWDKPDALAKLLKRYYPDLKKMLPIEADRYITFEYIGQENYLKEKTTESGRRTRGANCTSADAAVMFEKENGQKQIVLIEWKYTEAYSSTPLMIAKTGTNRVDIYKWFYDDPNTIIDKSIITKFDDLFYEPFYQLMRQQFLANEMEKTGELGADIVSVLHISPKANKDLHKVTSPNLKQKGEDVFELWNAIINNKERFKNVNTEDLFGKMDYTSMPKLLDWWNYIRDRYRAIV